jgi:hypothetical protein
MCLWPLSLLSTFGHLIHPVTSFSLLPCRVCLGLHGVSEGASSPSRALWMLRIGTGSYSLVLSGWWMCYRGVLTAQTTVMAWWAQHAGGSGMQGDDLERWIGSCLGRKELGGKDIGGRRLFLFNTALAICGLLCFQMNLRIVFFQLLW